MISELEALVILTTIPQLGAIRIRHLIEQFGSALATLNLDPEVIRSLPDFGPRIAMHWKAWQSDGIWEKNLELVKKHQVQLISYQDPLFPKSLLKIPDHPVLLYVQGSIEPRDQYSIAVVGTRNASIYGRESAEKIACDLAAAGFTVVSGLARGIDTAAHSGALKRGRTLAVIGSGLANIYPTENIKLAHAISKQGALMSEFPMATPPDRQNFPQRNRIVSGLSMATVLIEAPIKSGAMITMEKALSHKKRLFALPGRADDANFKGNHALIKNGDAQLIENAQDIIHSFEQLFDLKKNNVIEIRNRSKLNIEEENFLAVLPHHEIAIDEILQRSNLPATRVNALLMALLLKKVIKEFPGKIYKKVQET